MTVSNPLGHPRILIIYYSLSGQSRGLINLLASGMREGGTTVAIEKIQTVEKISFPFQGFIHAFWKMLITFLRVRTPIEKPSSQCFEPYDLIILAGPTWSYNPSGPILALLDDYGGDLFREKRVLPLLSCRGYYRLHDYILRSQLRRRGALLEQSLIFTHPVSEPWSTMGVFLRSAGHNPNKIGFLAQRYPHFGHSSEQLLLAKTQGGRIAECLKQGVPIDCPPATIT